MTRLLCCWLLLAAPAAADCLLGGAVTDGLTHKPLAGTKVYARWKGDPPRPAILHVTNAAGAFCFEKLPPGDYDLVAEHAGHLVTVLGGRPGEGGGAVFAIGPQAQIPPLRVVLLPFATVSGTVLDTRGQPLPGMSVELLRKRWSKGWNTEPADMTITDDRGAFRFSRTAPGTYYLRTGPGWQMRQAGLYLDENGQVSRPAEVATYYPSGVTLEHATPIVLEAGQEIPNLTVAMIAAVPRHISGRVPVTWPENQKPLVRLVANASNFVAEAPVGPDGSFSAQNLYPAQYGVRLEGVKTETGLYKTVDVTQGDADGVLLEPFPARVPVRLVVDLNGQTAPQSLEVVSLASGNQQWAQKGADGAYSFGGGLEPGRYRVKARSHDAYVQSLSIDGRARPGAVIDVQAGAPAEARAVLSGAMGRIEARIERPEAAANSPAVSLVWVDEADAVVDMDGEWKVVPQSGTLEVPSLAPGKYRLFAIEGFDERPWGCPELAAALEAKSVEVELKPGETGKAAVPLITSAEWTAALRKAGI